MNQLNTHAASITNPSNAKTDARIRLASPERTGRLIVLIPVNVDCSSLIQRIWELAVSTGSSVQLLGMCKDADQEPSLRRKLVSMSALIQDARVDVETRIEIGSSWLKAIKQHYQPGDAFVCITEQPTGIRRRPLREILESNFKATVYILSDLPLQRSESNIRSQVIAWSGFIGIIAGFFLVQVKVVQLPKDGFQTLLLVLLLFPEFWLLWAWNSLFS